MTVAQNYALVNNALAQVLGNGAITVVDTTTLADAGKKLAQFQNGYELFNKAILDVMIRTEIDNELFDITGIPFLSKTEKFGGFIREIYVGMPTANENKSWKIGDDGYTPEIPGVYKLPVTVKCYTNRGTHEFKWTIPDMQVDSAFHNNEELNAYFEGIGVAVENAVRIDILEISRLVRAKFIADTFAKALAGGNQSGTIVYVYDAFKLAFPSTTLTADSCWNDKEFLRFASELISRYPKRLAQVGAKYTNDKTAQGEDYIRQTSREHLIVEMIADIANKFKFFLDSDVYHNELVSLPQYNEIEFWQGQGFKDDAKDHCTLAITFDDGISDELVRVNRNDLIGIMYDDRSIIQIYDEPYSASFRNQFDRYTTNKIDSNYGFAYKTSHKAVIFATTVNADNTALIGASEEVKGFNVNASEQSSTYYGVAVSSLQYSDVSVAVDEDNGFVIEGRLKKMTATNNITNVWGKGYFLAVDFSGDYLTSAATNGVTSIKVGLEPSVSSGLVELIGADDNGYAVMKIAEVDGEILAGKSFVIELTKNGYTSRVAFDLSGLQCV